MRNLKLYLLSFLLFFIIGVLLLTVSELGLRWWTLSGAEERRDHVVETEFLPVTFRPNYEGAFWKTPFATNRYGFRDEPEIPETPVPGEIRIISLGDSIGFGLGIPAQDHYTKVAERVLGSTHQKRISVINAGGMGYSPSSYYVWLKEVGLRLQPHLVVIETELCNDISDEALLHWVTPDKSPYPESIRGGRYVVGWDGNLLGTQSTGRFFFEKSYLYTDLLRRFLNLMGRWKEDSANQPEGWLVYYSLGFDRTLLTRQRIEKGWSQLFTALEGTHRLLKEREIPLILMLMPSKYLYQNAGERTAAAQIIFERAIRMAGEFGLPWVSLKQPIQEAGGTQLFFDFAHLTTEGNRVVGKVLASQIERHLFPASDHGDEPNTPNSGN